MSHNGYSNQTIEFHPDIMNLHLFDEATLDRSFNGTIWELAFWKRALTPSDVAQFSGV